jgi:hypothetical protein
MQHDHKGDARAAFLGLILGAVILFSILYTIVRLTNARYARHAEPAATR